MTDASIMFVDNPTDLHRSPLSSSHSINTLVVATTRVLIECEDDNGDRWRSVGLSTNIIDASVMALYDSLTWRLLSLGITPAAPAN